MSRTVIGSAQDLQAVEQVEDFGVVLIANEPLSHSASVLVFPLRGSRHDVTAVAGAAAVEH